MKTSNTHEIIYNYLNKNYEPNCPIFLSDLKFQEISDTSVRYYMNKMAKNKEIEKFNNHTFYFPQKDLFGNSAPLAPRTVADAKYIRTKNHTIGFYSGNTFANYIGISDQVPYVKEICSNNATAPVRTVTIGNQKFVTRKPPVKITNDNYAVLQFLYCLKDLNDTADRDPKECKGSLSEYCRKHKISNSDIEQYISYFPEKIYKTIYQTGVELYVPA